MLKKLILILFVCLQFGSCKDINLSDKDLKKFPNIWLLALMGQKPNTQSTSVVGTYPTNDPISVQAGQQLILGPSQHIEGSTYSVSPTLPAGLIINSSTGIISGTPTMASSSSQYTITQVKPDRTKVNWVITLSVTTSGSSTSIIQAPILSPASGHYNTPQYITFSITTGSEIRCTTDGQEPTTSSAVYSNPVHIYNLAGLTLKCKTFLNGLSSETVTRKYSYQTIATGQTSIYATGDNGTNQTGVARSYTNNGDGTVMDNYSGLIWQRCSRGQNNDSSCSGTATTANWATAESYCSGLSLAGKTWRLPTLNELADLVDYSAASPAINTTNFPATVANYYWSSKAYTFVANYKWAIGFDYGSTNGFNESGNFYIRCISGQSVENHSFTDSGDGTVKDNKSGLVWQKCSRGQNNDSTCSGTATTANWTNALTYCSGLGLAGKTWRLPTIIELMSILDFNKSTTPIVNTSVFPNTVSNAYSSSTTFFSVASSSWLAYVVNANALKTSSFNVRCVSGP